MRLIIEVATDNALSANRALEAALRGIEDLSDVTWIEARVVSDVTHTSATHDPHPPRT